VISRAPLDLDRKLPVTRRRPKVSKKRIAQDGDLALLQSSGRPVLKGPTGSAPVSACTTGCAGRQLVDGVVAWAEVQSTFGYNARTGDRVQWTFPEVKADTTPGVILTRYLVAHVPRFNPGEGMLTSPRP
jgi:hypothetical protein